MMILCTDIITKEKSLIINNIGKMINKKKVRSTQIVYKHYISASSSQICSQLSVHVRRNNLVQIYMFIAFYR